MADQREINHKWYNTFDETMMVIEFDTGEYMRPGIDNCSCYEQPTESVEYENPDDPEDAGWVHPEACTACKGAGFTEPFTGKMRIPAKYEVCETCCGRGKHVNPSIDSNGLTQEDFAEDPDFGDAYWRGDYDVPCSQCGGERVVPAPDRDRITESEKKCLNRVIAEHYNDQAEQANYRKMGY